MSKELPTSVPTPVTTSKLKLVQEFLGTLALLSPWSLLLFQLSITWKTNEQYAHGYLVPFLCVFLLLKAGPTNSIEKNGGPKASVSKKLWFFVGIPLGIFDTAKQLSPKAEIWTSEKLPFLKTDDCIVESFEDSGIVERLTALLETLESR